MKRIVSIWMITAMLLVFAACQATPEEPIVIKKDTERLVEQAGLQENGTRLDALSLPEGQYTHEDTGAAGRLKIKVDACVKKPNSANMPILKVSKGSFSQETVMGIFNYLFPDEKPYNRITVQSKADIEKDLINMRKQLADGSYKNNDFSEEEYRELIVHTESRYAAAPETVPPQTVSDGMLRPSEIKGGVNMLDVASDTASLMVVNPADSFAQADKHAAMLGTSLLNYRKHKAPDYNTLGMVRTDGSDLPEAAKRVLTIPYAEAKALCDGFFEAANLAGSFCLGSSFIVDDRGTGLVDGKFVNGTYIEGPKAPAQHYAYQFYYTRVAGGIPAAVNPSYGGSPGDGISTPWLYEYACFTVDNDGIAQIMWTDPVEVGEIVEESSALKPFDEIIEIFGTMIKTVYTAQLDLNAGSTLMEVNVDDIQLCLLRIRNQNSGDASGFLVPAWVFYGHNFVQYDTGSISYDWIGGGSKSWPEAPIVLLAINAIDGSIIDMTKGY